MNTNCFKIWSFALTALLSFFFACGTLDNTECLKTTGEIRSYEIDLEEPFDRIAISTNVDVEITQSEIQRVELLTGENIFENIECQVVDGELVFRSNSSCNWARGYGTSILKIFTPDLEAISSEGGGVIRSTNLLRLTNLKIDTNESSGDYHLNVDIQKEMDISSRRISNFFIEGNTKILTLNFFSGDGRFYGENLIAEEIYVRHNGTNDIMVYPTRILEGEILLYGNLIYYNDPSEKLEVDMLSKGTLVRAN